MTAAAVSRITTRVVLRAYFHVPRRFSLTALGTPVRGYLATLRTYYCMFDSRSGAPPPARPGSQPIVSKCFAKRFRHGRKAHPTVGRRITPRNVPAYEENTQPRTLKRCAARRSILSPSANPPRPTRSVICPANGCGASSVESPYPTISAWRLRRGSATARTKRSGTATNPR